MFISFDNEINVSFFVQLQNQVEVLNDKCVCANADLKADMERWHKNKRKDFRKLFVDMADRNVKYYEKVNLFYYLFFLSSSVFNPNVLTYLVNHCKLNEHPVSISELKSLGNCNTINTTDRQTS